MNLTIRFKTLIKWTCNKISYNFKIKLTTLLYFEIRNVFFNMSKYILLDYISTNKSSKIGVKLFNTGRKIFIFIKENS